MEVSRSTKILINLKWLMWFCVFLFYLLWRVYKNKHEVDRAVHANVHVYWLNNAIF